jgi:hypothetical protein
LLTHEWFVDFDFEGVLTRKFLAPYLPEALSIHLEAPQPGTLREIALEAEEDLGTVIGRPPYHWDEDF